MTDEELEKRLDRIERHAAEKGHFFIIIALLILLARGC